MDPSLATLPLEVAKTVAAIADANKRRAIESNLALLSHKDQLALAEQMGKLQNRTEQINFLINAVMAARQAQADRDQRSQTVLWIILGSAGVITLGVLAWYLKD